MNKVKKEINKPTQFDLMIFMMNIKMKLVYL